MSKLFRSEALEYRAGNLPGEVNLALPIKWQAIGYLMFVAVVIAICFLFLASYSRVENVNGVIVPDKGVLAVSASRPGVIEEVYVREAQLVKRGAPIARIGADEYLRSGLSAAESYASDLQQQSAMLDNQSEAAETAANASIDKLRAEATGVRRELSALDDQIKTQQHLQSVAQEEVDIASIVNRRGFISRHDLLERQEGLLTRQQGLEQLFQTKASKRSSLEQISEAIRERSAQRISQVANLKATKAEIRQRLIGNEANRGYVLRAPASGRITSVVGQAGQPIAVGSEVASIIPARSLMRANIFVPPSAIGFLSPGQEVRLSADAYPYQQFGSLVGRLSSVPSAPVIRRDNKGVPQPVYVATVTLDQPWIWAYGRRQPLITGMILTARVITRKQSLVGWLFEPIFAVARR